MNDRERPPGTAGKLRDLIVVSTDLREAMRARDAERIQDVVRRQEERIRQLATLEAVEVDDYASDESIEVLINRLRRLQESNRLMANAFARLYRSTLRRISGDEHPDPGVYGNAGRMMTEPVGPMLLRQTG